MARRKTRKSELELTANAFSGLPWQLCLVLAVIVGFGFHKLAQIQPPPAQDIAQLGANVQVTILRTAGMFLQVIAPMVLLFAAIKSWNGKRRRSKMLAEAMSRTAGAPLREMNWREFEQVVGAHFERNGYAVRFTPDGADGGVDVIARKGSETFLIQCKQWRATQVGVKVVRELFGVMAARGAAGAFVVSIGPFTTDAKAFAEGRNITLVDANALLASQPSAPPPIKAAPPLLPPSASPPTPPVACPKCGAAMVRRIAKQGVNKGQAFYGCSTYPRCHGIVPGGSG